MAAPARHRRPGPNIPTRHEADRGQCSSRDLTELPTLRSPPADDRPLARV